MCYHGQQNQRAKNKLKSLQNKMIALRKEHFYSRRAGNFVVEIFASTKQWIKLVHVNKCVQFEISVNPSTF